MNDIYILYKLVFNNIYLLKKIYKYVRAINREICNNNSSSISITKRLRYDEITSLDWIIKNNHFELLYDKIKSNNSTTTFNKEGFTNNNLKIILKHTNFTNHEILIKFNEKFKSLYNNLVIVNLNKHQQHQQQQDQQYSIYYHLIELSIQCNNFEFLKIIYKDYLKQQKQQQEAEVIDSIKNQKSILLIALKYGNIEIIKFVNEIIGIKIIEIFNQVGGGENIKILMNSVESENRENVILYLLDDLKLNFKNSQQNCRYTTGSFYQFYINLLNLNFKLFKRLIENEFKIGSQHFFKDLIFSKILEVYNTTIRMYLNYLEFEKSTSVITFDKFLNFFQIIIYLSYLIDDKKEKYNEILKKINQLSSSCNFKSNYNKREIIRIILFEFIFNIKESINISNNEWIILILNYISKFKQYNFLKDYIDRGKIEKSEYLIQQLFIISIKYSDYELLEILSTQKNKNIFKNITIELFNTNLISKQQQINFIHNLFKFGYNKSNHEIVSLILKQFFKQTQIEIIDSILIGEILKNYMITSSNGSKSIKFNASILIGTPISIFKFYYLNYNQLFKWNLSNIGYEVLEFGNLELIQFIYENNIGSLQLSISLNYTKTTTIAKYMHDNLGFRFNGQLLSISRLDELKSEYLFKYAINCLILSNYHQNSNNNIIMVHRSIQFNYNQLNFIKSLCNSGKLDSNKFMIDKSPISNYFSNLNDFKFILNTCDLKLIFNYLKNENILNKNSINKKLYNEIYTNIKNNNNDGSSSSSSIINDINYIEFIKNYFKKKLNKIK